MRTKRYNFSKLSFHRNCDVFARSQKNFNFAEIIKIDEGRVIFEKKTLLPSKRFFQQNCWAEDMPVVAGRHVKLSKETSVRSAFPSILLL